ncbi:hypothetical protein [Streptomyces buecherae]|uniref:DUF7848 domain-containing protein n=1 Tax=Streptomyces buecherae TaxID=2763006 RepID=UPI0036780A34
MTRSHYRFVAMTVDMDPSQPPPLTRAVCRTCGDRSPEADPAYDLDAQCAQAQRWCSAHTARDHPGGRHFDYTATLTWHWTVTPEEDIGPSA